MSRFIGALALLLAIALALGACAPVAEPPPQAVAVTDALGREVAVPVENLRVAALLGSFADVYTLAGGRVVAASADAWEDFSLPLEGAVNLGGAHSPSLEALFSASPTLVLASASSASHVALKEPLEAAGISVVYFKLNSVEDYLHMLRFSADLTGREDLYEKNGVSVKERVDAVCNLYKSSPLPDEKRKVLFLRASSGFVKAKGSEGSVLGEMLLDLGCINIADMGSGLLESLNVEQVIKEEPYHIFIVAMGDDEAAALSSLDQMMSENPAWGTLRAVQEGRLHVLDKTLFHLKPNARWGGAYETLFEILAEE
ncbi:MAG: ABC transporter substrate-binding protein [Ruminococcaceae bacterium]|nr:ABC transporter substrate-binding protein [Oscillospiraceae bacterium]